MLVFSPPEDPLVGWPSVRSRELIGYSFWMVSNRSRDDGEVIIGVLLVRLCLVLLFARRVSVLWQVRNDEWEHVKTMKALQADASRRGHGGRALDG